MNDRLKRLRWCIIIAFGVVVARLYYWQIIRAQDLQEAASAQYQRTSLLSVSRGNIFSADGYPLAMNERVFTLFAQPKQLGTSPSLIAGKLATTIPFEVTEATESATLDPKEVESYFLERLSDRSRSWVALKHNLTADTKRTVESLSIKGLGFDPGEIRYYPEGSMAAHLLGFVGKDTQGNAKGYFGIEGRFDLELKGKVGKLSQETDAFGNPIAIGDFIQIDAHAARDVYLTVRRDIQHVLEEKIENAIEKYGAKSADAVILDPHTGKVLAMASYPRYEPEKFYKYPPSTYKNPLVADSYEPGSTFKVLTVASGIDTGVVTPDTPCDDCGGPKTIGKYTIRTWNNEYTRNITVRDALAKSDNTAMMFVADKVGKDAFVSYINNFGFGQKTGVELQDETSPSLRERWGDIDVATTSFGQGIAVTGMQVVNAVAAIANGGNLMRPYIVDKVIAGDQEYVTSPKVIRRVIKPETATTVTEMMIEAAAHGDAKWAIPKGYVIAGKTGTAQIPVDGHYDEERTIASFVGFAPANNPQFVMLVRVSEPQTSQWGSETAAPLWFSIARELFTKLNIAPSK